MIRLLAGGVLCLCIAYIGLGIKRHYVARAKFYEDLLDFINIISENINFIKTPLPKLIDDYQSNKKGEFIKLINCYNTSIKNGSVNKSMLVRVNCLNSNEQVLVNEMLSTLGKLDSGTQLSNLNSYKIRVTVCKDVAVKKSSTVGNLAFKLGVLIGILTLIILA